MKKLPMILFALFHYGAALAQPVSEELSLDVGGNSIYLEIAGPSDDAPLLVYLHGGPGNAALGIAPFKSNIGSQLHEEFLVTYVHQRGAGRSSSVSASELTISAHIEDVTKVVDYLTNRFNREQVHLIGHSWGGVLAVYYANERSERVESLILIASPMNMRATYQDSHAVTLSWAQQSNLSEAIEQLSALDQGVPSLENRRLLNRWANQAYGGIAGQFDMQSMIQRYNINEDFPDWAQQQMTISQAMMPELTDVDLDDAIASFDIPALFVGSALDSIVPERTVRRDYENYGGPKTLMILDDSHHLPFVDQPIELSKVIDSFLSEWAQ